MEEEKEKTDAITTAIFNAGVAGCFYGSSLWQHRQFVFDESAVKRKYYYERIGYLSVEKIMFQSPAQNIAQPLYTMLKQSTNLVYCTYFQHFNTSVL